MMDKCNVRLRIHQLHHYYYFCWLLCTTLLILSVNNGRFCLKSLSLLRSTGVCLARILRTCAGAPSGGHGQNRSMTGTIGLCRISASVKSLIQLSLCMYFGVMQLNTSFAAFMLRCICDCRFSPPVSSDNVLLLERPLTVLGARWRDIGAASAQQLSPQLSRLWRISSTRDCMSHW